MDAKRIPLVAVTLIAAVYAVNWWLSAGRRRPPAVALPEAEPRPRTRDELYEIAKRLDIPGRSRMNKAELQAAVAGNGG
jgi:hypothetical protein